MKKFEEFADKIGVKFNNIDFLQQAFTHRSYINENPGVKTGHNERLEFLGDAVLELVVTDFLYEKYPDKPEGELTAYRAALVNTISISRAATELGANEYLLLSKGEAKDTGKARQYILANTFEAIIGAVYVDQGYDAAQKFIENSLFHYIDEVIENRLWQDAKSYFQEQAQEHVSITPAYQVLEEVGPDHDKQFTVGIFLKDEQIAKGQGRSKQDAEQAAAKAGLEAKGWE
ncbi:ribonuclease III [Patescibacteria group bacterium]